MFIKPSKIKANRAAVINFMAATFFVFQFKMAICGASICYNATSICYNATGIPVNATGIPINATGIPVNATGIPVNTTGIYYNATGICYHVSGKILPPETVIVKPKYNLPLPDV